MDEKPEKQDQSVHIDGSAIGSPINTGIQQNVNMKINVNGVNISTTKTITINKMYLEKMPKEYADSLQAFATDLNQHLKETNAPTEAVKQLQIGANQVAKETAEIKPETGVSTLKKIGLSARLADFARTIVKASPKYAEKIASMTPLAPFSKLIGEGFEKIVAEVLKEEQPNNKTS